MHTPYTPALTSMVPVTITMEIMMNLQLLHWSLVVGEADRLARKPIGHTWGGQDQPVGKDHKVRSTINEYIKQSSSYI